ncbi:MAG: endonuclease/exonuclease/phosphatase family protein [Balneolaceae bacterium]|nr:endonuclease/exonuclease/phosphatase family protein [Balneolaceae bacterium]
MKAIIYFFLLSPLAFGLFGSITSTKHEMSEFMNQETPHSIRVMSFNLRLDTPTDSSDAWPHRKEMVARTMRFHKADFVGIQEGLPHQLEQLDEMLPYFNRIGVGRNTPDDPGEYSAIYYKKDRFELIENDTFWLSETPNEVASVGWDAALPRIVTWGEFRDRDTGNNFFVFNTHFDHRGKKARRESAALIVDKIYEIAGNQPVVLTGDFNTTENDPPYNVLTGSEDGQSTDLEDGFYHAQHGHHGPTSTWNGFEEILPDRRIDFIFTNSGFDVLNHAILADQYDGRFPSDHLPVAADIKFSGE